MNPEYLFGEELSMIDSLLVSEDSSSAQKISDLLSEFHQIPINLPSGIPVYIVQATKLDEIQNEFAKMSSTIQEKETEAIRNLEEKLKFQEENEILKKEINLRLQNEALMNSQTDAEGIYKPLPFNAFSNFPKPSFPMSQAGFGFSFSQFSDLNKINQNSDLFSLEISELKNELQRKNDENNELFKKIESLQQSFALLSQEKEEFLANFEKSDLFYRMRVKIENQSNIIVSLQEEAKALYNKLNFFQNLEKEKNDGLINIKEAFSALFVDLIDELQQSSLSVTNNEIISRYFPETLKRLKLKLENESLKDQLSLVSKDLEEQKLENKQRIEIFLKEVFLFEEMKENILKKINEYLEEIKTLAKEKIQKFEFAIEEFRVIDSHCLKLNKILEEREYMIQELKEKLSNQLSISQKLIEKYEADVLINKTFIQDINKLTNEKNEMENKLTQYKNELQESKLKSQNEIENLKEKLSSFEKKSKILEVEVELLNLSCKKGMANSSDINFQLFQHFKQNYENLSLDNQVYLNQLNLTKKKNNELSLKLNQSNEENLELKKKLLLNSPENYLISLITLRETSLKEIIEQNNENNRSIKELSYQNDKLLEELRLKQIQINNLFNDINFFLGKETETPNPEQKILYSFLNIIEMLEKSKSLLSLGQAT